MARTASTWPRPRNSHAIATASSSSSLVIWCLPVIVGRHEMYGEFYHAGSRAMQDAFRSRPVADRLEERTLHEAFTPSDRAFIEGSIYFFLATADANGHPDVS